MRKLSVTKPAIWISLALVVMTLAVFGQVRDFPFIGLDDIIYLMESPHVSRGLTPAGAAWAFTNNYFTYWHPLTWLSHMATVDLFGMDPGGHHVINLSLHLLNVLLLFLVLNGMTLSPWRSGFVAALFAIHPLHVEPVAWVAARTDVLSTSFFLLALWAYARYVKMPGPGRHALVAAFFALGLMVKPALVVLPFTLLLLDYWPLGRFQAAASLGNREDFLRDPVGRLLREKAIFFAMAGVSCLVTYLTQVKVGAVTSFSDFPLGARAANALVAYAGYLGKTVWPFSLAVIYPHPMWGLPAWKVAASGLLLAGVSVLAVRLGRKLPFLAMGWFWFLGTLVPMINLIQSGWVAMADRYTYIPLIGLFVMAAWGIPEPAGKFRYRAWVLGIPAAAALSLLATVAWAQVGLWQNSRSLFRHAVEVTTDNWMGHYLLGNALYEEGKFAEAIAQYRRSVDIQPLFPDAHNNLGNALVDTGAVGEAVSHYRESLRLRPGSAKTYNNLGAALEKLGKGDEALLLYREAIRIQPDLPNAHFNLGNALFLRGRIDEAIPHYREAVRGFPGNPMVLERLNMALALRKMEGSGPPRRTPMN
jgi:tetratricopeptide (TPR) repeat protein